MTALVRRSSRWTPIGIGAVILGFMAWWPLGLAVLGYIIWGGSVDDVLSDLIAKAREYVFPTRPASTGNAAFDAYKRETLARLEREQEEFAAYLEQLRQARDKEEFERFMAERARKAD